MIVRYVDAWQLYETSCEKLGEDGAVKTFTHNNTDGINPHFKVMNAMASKMITCLTRLGLTPTVRAATKAAGPDNSDLDLED